MMGDFPEVKVFESDMTEAVPETEYDNFVPTTFTQHIRLLKKAEGRVIIDEGDIVVIGRKFNKDSGRIASKDLRFKVEDLQKALDTAPEFKNAYFAFIEALMYYLAIDEAIKVVSQMNVNNFEPAMRYLRRAYQKLDMDEMAQKVRQCIQNYPGTWDMETCLRYLDLIV